MKNYLYSVFRIASLFFLILSLSHLASFGQGLGHKMEARLQAALDKIQNDKAKPFVGGMSVAVKVENLAKWQGALGYAARNIDKDNNLLPGGTAFKPGTLSQIYSVTKTFTAPLVLELVKEGVFKLEDPISKYLPFGQINPRLNSKVTIHQLLAHESGYSDYAVEQQLQISVAAQPGRTWTALEAIAFTNQIFAPGTERRYSSTNYIVLGALVEVITKKPVEQHYRDRFFKPLNLESMYLGVREPLGNRGELAAPHDNLSPFNPVFAQTGQPLFPNAYTNIFRFPMTAIVSLAFTGGGIVSNAADLAEWGSALFTGRATSKETLNLMLNSFSPTPDMNGNYLGYGIKQIPRISDKEMFLGHNGDAVGYRSILVHQPERKITLAVLANFAAADPYAIAKAVYQALAPKLESFSPKQGLPGKTINIKGEGLSITTSVLFNGKKADFKIINESTIKAVVPANASSGQITVVTAGGTVLSNRSFTVQQPQITTFIPDHGEVGSSVFLVGNHLTKVKEVYFNGVKAAKVRSYFDFLVMAEVPKGATTGKIKVVLTGGGKATSSSDFRVTQSTPVIIANQKSLISEKQPTSALVTIPSPDQPLVSFPNPFKEKITFNFSLPVSQNIQVKVFNSQGKEVAFIYQGTAQANQKYQLQWKPGSQDLPGLYFMQLQTDNQVKQQKIIFTR
ncbi:serine hydrolase [Adhaeribacter radiodurans]|uniref:Serine hydrolase n=1 Tax=Adhaeribacter radiodurans TaxID=2745197 RepID=A0A7L7LAN9_9BACT|nr:serine hydrolase [Adhaeribacter radiodurans]QMU29896.1 serine hydrolase [Adhaeribacter radiodurans]